MHSNLDFDRLSLKFVLIVELNSSDTKRCDQIDARNKWISSREISNN